MSLETAALKEQARKDEPADKFSSGQVKRNKPEWPEPLDAAAFHGITGEITRAIEPHTESDPAAVLVQLLAAAGNFIGRGPYFQVESDRHHSNIFPIIVGNTSKGRKGTGWSRARDVFDKIDDPWTKERISSGLSSGEGLIWSVRDQISHMKEDKVVVDDNGIDDKRLLVIESEFASTLRVMERDGSTLSTMIRQCWDRGDLRTMTKNSPAVATGAHISIIGHITADELRRYLTRTESANGFANRFLFVCSQRSKILPEGGADVDMSTYARRLAMTFDKVRQFGRLCFNEEARAMWHSVYPSLSEGRPGLFGAVTSRSEAQTIRLALVYALLDGADHIAPAHLTAALAVWAYCEASARFVFGDQIGDPIADELLTAIRSAGTTGMTRTEISHLFNRHRNKAQIGAALDVLKRFHEELAMAAALDDAAREHMVKREACPYCGHEIDPAAKARRIDQAKLNSRAHSDRVRMGIRTASIGFPLEQRGVAWRIQRVIAIDIETGAINCGLPDYSLVST